MGEYLLQKVFQAAITSGASVSTGIDFRGTWRNVYLDIPKVSNRVSDPLTPIYVLGSSDGERFRRYETISGVSNQIVPIPDFRMQYLQLEISGVATNNVNFKIICSDS